MAINKSSFNVGSIVRKNATNDRLTINRDGHHRYYDDYSSQLVSASALVSYWKMDESSGNATDSVGTNTLTDNNTVTSASGIINTGRQFKSGSNESFSVVSNASLTGGDVDVTVGGWVYLDTTPGEMHCFGKWNESASREYSLIYATAGGSVFKFQLSENGTSTSILSATTFGAVSACTWYHVIGWFDSANNQIGISVNGISNTASAPSAFSGTAPLFIGSRTGAGNFLDGRIDEAFLFRRVLTSTEINNLYNGGVGLAYPFTG